MDTTSRIVISDSEIMQALTAASGGSGPDEARTVAELCQITKQTDTRVRSALKQLKLSGRLELHRVRRESLDGRMAVVTGYTVKPA